MLLHSRPRRLILKGSRMSLLRKIGALAIAAGIIAGLLFFTRSSEASPWSSDDCHSMIHLDLSPAESVNAAFTCSDWPARGGTLLKASYACSGHQMSIELKTQMDVHPSFAKGVFISITGTCGGEDLASTIPCGDFFTFTAIHPESTLLTCHEPVG